MVTNGVAKGLRGPKSDFGLLVYDPQSSSGPFTILMEGPWVESWGAQACKEVAGLLGMAERKTTVTILQLAAGIHIEIPTLVAPVPPHVIAVSVRTDACLPVRAREKGAFSVALPTFEVEALTRILMGAAKCVGHRKEMPESMRISDN